MSRLTDEEIEVIRKRFVACAGYVSPVDIERLFAHVDHLTERLVQAEAEAAAVVEAARRVAAGSWHSPEWQKVREMRDAINTYDATADVDDEESGDDGEVG